MYKLFLKKRIRKRRRLLLNVHTQTSKTPVMNLFFLNIDPEQCAKEHCDKHVVKMLLETVQMLYTAHHVKGKVPDFAYRIAHTNHPTCVWVRHCYENYLYTVNLAKYLSIEYTYRYNKIHSCQKHVDWLLVNVPFKIDKIEMTPIPLSMPIECKIINDPIKSYRKYYILKKQYFAKWTSRPIPRWYTPLNLRTYFTKFIKEG